jgi:RimJ/RimL family protein N-acetyltransferase
MPIHLIPLERDLARTLASGDFETINALAGNAYEVSIIVQDVASRHLALYDRTGAEAPWIGYLGRDKAAGVLIGHCGFKDICRDGQVEIAYATFPTREGRGFGVAMAAALIAIAWRQDEVMEVTAHTPTVESSATRILKRLEFEIQGATANGGGAPVWRWRLRRPKR